MLPEDGFALTELRLREPVHPPVRLAEFRETMAGLAATVSVVATAHAHETIGRTVTAALSLGATPPSVLVSIDITARLADLIVMSRGFSLAMLAQGQETIGDAFAGKLGDDRFTYGDWRAWPSGNPMLMGAAATLDCELIGSIDTGTHVLFAGAIINSEIAAAAEPLIWHRHRYRSLTDQGSGEHTR
ncbi:flavin reductase family protein [uncultured Devosia sp.]|uniref:flavin reductase family protein n=1 Tax=uncultured Devosia sp. TaxID=211434 RepID=UPI0035CBE283